MERENALLKEEQHRRTQEVKEDWKLQLESQVEKLSQVKELEYNAKLAAIESSRAEAENSLQDMRATIALRDKQLELLEAEKQKHLAANSQVGSLILRWKKGGSRKEGSCSDRCRACRKSIVIARSS